MNNTNSAKKQRIAYLTKSSPLFRDGKRRCSTCHEWKPLDDFYKNPSMAGGVNSQCKKCATLTQKETKKPSIPKTKKAKTNLPINQHKSPLTERMLSICASCLGGCIQGRGCPFLQHGAKRFKLAKPTDQEYFHDWYHKNKDILKKKYHEYLAANPEKQEAWTIITNMIRSGELTRPDKCTYCNKTKFVEPHHDDYSKPREIRWLCLSCHRKIHRNGL
jgi:hypothetical protein